MRSLIFVFKDGTEVESSYEPPYSVNEQLDWEEHFRSSFLAIQQCVEAMRDAAEEGRPVDPTMALRTAWILWFGWHRARPKVPASFGKFRHLLADWRIDFPEGEEEPESGGEQVDAADAGTDGSLDPTGTTPDPTGTTEPSVPVL